ncbi:tetratricopeptide repeat protein [candidate division WOR-3 bacterium]|nr:tetratricopeptide repeat protein [candidate division WOR-3 bacterium]
MDSLEGKPVIISENEEKFMALLEKADRFLGKDPEKAIYYAQKALDIAEADSDEHRIVRALQEKGKCLAVFGKLSESLKCFEKALEIAEKIGNESLKCSLLNSLGLNKYYLGDYYAAFENLSEAADMSKKNGNEKILVGALSNLGLVYEKMGNYEKALESLLKCLDLEDRTGSEDIVKADTLGNIGTIYESISDNDKAIEYYGISLELYIKARSARGIAGALSNMANIFNEKGNSERAEKYYFKALKFARNSKNIEFQSKILNNLGFLYSKKKMFKKSIEFYEEALRIDEEKSDKSAQANVLNNIAKVLKELGEIDSALEKAEKSLSLASGLSEKRLKSEVLQNYSEILHTKGMDRKAFRALQKSARISDSIYEDSIAKKITDLEIRFEVEKRQRESELAKARMEIYRLKNAELSELLFTLESEKNKAESLLEVVFPKKIIEDLKMGKMTSFKNYENVTVLYADIAGFTQISAGLTPDILIGELNEIFSAFDSIFEEYCCERIMTIGDACLAAFGLFDENEKDPEKMLKAALDICRYIKKRNLKREPIWPMRLGIHTGKVLGGVMGGKRYVFDIMGETVDKAKKIQSSVEPGVIGISCETAHILKDKFVFSELGVFSFLGYDAIRIFTLADMVK